MIVLVPLVMLTAQDAASPVLAPPAPPAPPMYLPIAPPPPPPPPPSLGPRPPSYANRPAVIRAKDYPKAERKAGIEGMVWYRVAVSAKGKPTGCTILQSSGHPALDAKSCRMILKRARFRPATDAKGKAVPGTLDARVVWRMPKW